jgi:serine/threonine protein kinase
MAWQLLVIDGADQGRYFPLADEGTITLGSSRKNADVVLHDLYVSRIHCQLEASAEGLVVTDLESPSGTFINGQKITQVQSLQAGDVLRVGNSHMRLEVALGREPDASAASAPAPVPEAPPEPPLPAKLPHLPAERLAELSGHYLAHYEIGPVLGKGHCGVVFRARDRKSDQLVALKVLLPQFPANDAEMSLFVRTMKTLLPLRHSHLVGQFGAGKTGRYCWIAQEYIEGESLAQVLERMGSPGKLAWKHALRLGIHVGRALAYLHSHNILHGNLTPFNILIRLGDKTVKLSDLLLSKALDGSALQLATLEAKLLAELGYLSPEQAHPDAFVDSLSDIYGLGAVMYARLTGRPPFQGQSPEQTLAMIHEAPLVKPTAYQTATPEAVEAAVLKMLARRQADRYQTPAELLTELEEFAEDEGLEGL